MQLNLKKLYPNYYLEGDNERKDSSNLSSRFGGMSSTRRGMQRTKSAFLKCESVSRNFKSSHRIIAEGGMAANDRKEWKNLDSGGVRLISRHASNDGRVVRSKQMKDTRSSAISSGFDQIRFSPIGKDEAANNVIFDSGRERNFTHRNSIMNASRSMPNMVIAGQLSLQTQDSSFFLTEPKDSMLEKCSTIAQVLALGSVLLYGYNCAQEASGIWRNALDYFQPRHNVQLAALLHHHIGISCREDPSKLEDALAMQKECLRLSVQCDDSRLMARAHKTLGAIYLDKEEVARSSWHQSTALKLALQSRDMELEGRIHANLGNLALYQNDLELALILHKRDLELASSTLLNSSVAQARAHQNLAIVYRKARQIDRAQHHEKLAKVYGKSAFLVDIKHHLYDAVGNIYAQISGSSSSALTCGVAQALEALLRITDRCSNPALISLQDIAHEQLSNRSYTFESQDELTG